MGNESQNLPGTFWRTGSGNYLAQIRQQTTVEKDAEVTWEHPCQAHAHPITGPLSFHHVSDKSTKVN